MKSANDGKNAEGYFDSSIFLFPLSILSQTPFTAGKYKKPLAIV
jgi:hypothetical protein